MLTIQNLNITFDTKPLVTDFSLTVADGEIVCLRGESGCGKTSILRAILGFIDYQGTITLDSHTLTPDNISTLRQQMAYVPQDTLMPYDTVRDMIQGILSLRANTTPWDSHSIMHEWTYLDLDDSLYESPLSQLSGGQRQRIMLSIVALPWKKLLLLDEPTSALDDHTASRVADYLHRLAQQRNIPILAVSHSTHFASLCDREVGLGVKKLKELEELRR